MAVLIGQKPSSDCFFTGDKDRSVSYKVGQLIGAVRCIVSLASAQVFFIYSHTDGLKEHSSHVPVFYHQYVVHQLHMLYVTVSHALCVTVQGERYQFIKCV